MQSNVKAWGAASVAAGAALVWMATSRRRRSSRSNTKIALGGARGVHVYETIVINRPPSELFSFWRDFSNLPRFMEHLADVQVLSPTRSVWTAKAPAGMRVKWEAEVINEIPGELIGWQSTENADVATAGSVKFAPAFEGGTEIIVHLQYEPPARKLGALVAAVFGEEPSQQIRSDLRRLKTLLESGGARRGAEADVVAP